LSPLDTLPIEFGIPLTSVNRARTIVSSEKLLTPASQDPARYNNVNNCLIVNGSERYRLRAIEKCLWSFQTVKVDRDQIMT
jgi:hypothetical protein